MSIGTNVAEATIMPWKALSGFVLIFLLISSLQSCVAKEVEESLVEKLNNLVVARNATCTVSSFDKNGKMQLDCGGHGTKTMHNMTLALAHAVENRRLNCTLYRGNEPDCEVKAK